MLPGYNHNICYKGQVFHIQTEDSGVDHPHVITLLFVKGNIIARKKKDYHDILSFDRLDDAVRELMQDQHKDMLRELKTGRYDGYLGAPTKDDQTVCAAEPAPPPAPPKPAVAPPRPAAPSGARVPPPAPTPGQRPAPYGVKPLAPSIGAPIGARVPSPAQPQAPSAAKPPLVPPLGAPIGAPIGARVPPPAQPLAQSPARPTASPPARPVAPPPPPAPEPEIEEKPASKTITLSEEMELKDEDIFGADMISDRSLDEVILSFLSKEMDEDDE